MTKDSLNKIKVSFLNNYPVSTQIVYKHFFEKVSTMELIKGKDLNKFDINDIEELMRSFSIIYVGVARSYGTIISSYINWCIDHNIIEGPNPLSEYKTEWFEQFIDSSKIPIRWTYSDIIRICDMCENAQDGVILLFAFEGVTGRENAEMRNIKKSDLNVEDNTILLTDADGSQRTIKLSDKCIKEAISASKQKIYIKKNGMMIQTDNVRDHTDLIDNDYVIRSSITKTFELGPVNKYVIYRRVAIIAECFGLTELNIKNIVRSGMIYYGKCLREEQGQLGKEQLLLVAEKFKVKSLHMVKTIVNEESIKQLYGN
ncbi:hypothetical protein [Paenibacillus sp. FSL E2-0178]|uniref:phage lytic cycle repressor MrpR family protein n=1 Tax=Paenibacillus sp. FSL E2-0178 TaxID=2921361 RepID=UPI0031583B5B